MAKYDKLLRSIEQLNKDNLVSRSLRANYAEYYVANEIEKLGYNTKVGFDNKTDIFIHGIEKKVEVKSCVKGGWFGNTQTKYLS